MEPSKAYGVDTMRKSDIQAGKAFLLVGGNSYRVVDSVDDGRVRWHNDAISLKSCSLAQFMKACDREMTPGDEARFGITPEAKIPRW
jgi:hypothetical protein